MYNFFVLRASLERECIAAAVSLMSGAIVFGMMCVKYQSSDEGAAFAASAVVALPVALMVLHVMRRPRPKMQPVEDEHWDERESMASFATFWKSLDREEREGLQWLSSMIAANVLSDIHDDYEPPMKLHPRNVDEFEKMVRGSGQRDVLLALKGGTRKFVRVRVNHRTGQVLYSMKTEDT